MPFDYTYLIDLFHTLFYAALKDCFAAMAGVLLLCFIVAAAQHVFGILSARVVGGGSRVSGGDDISYASGYQDQYSDSVAGASHRSGSLYVPQEGYELRVDSGDAEIMVGSASGAAVPYQTGDQVANSYVSNSYEDQYADAAAGTGAGALGGGSGRSSYNLSDVPPPAPKRDGITNA